MIKNKPKHPVKPNPYIFPNSILPLNIKERPNSTATINGPAISSYWQISLSLNPLYVNIAENFYFIFSISISSSSNRGGSFSNGLLGSIILSYYYVGIYWANGFWTAILWILFDLSWVFG